MPTQEQIEEQFSDIDHVPLSVMEHMGSYWKTVSDRRKLQHSVSIKRIMVGQLITVIVVGLSSFLIEDKLEAFLLVGSTLLLYPALTDLLLSSGAVLSATIHHDIERQDESAFRYGLFAITKSILGTTIAGLIVGCVAGIIGFFALDIPFFDTVQLAFIATLMSAIIGLPLVLFVTFIIRNVRSNPDEVIPALESSVFNVVMLLSIAMASRYII